MGYSCSDEFDISRAIKEIRVDQKTVFFLEHVVGQHDIVTEPIGLKEQKNPFAEFPNGHRVHCDTDTFVDQLARLFPDLNRGVSAGTASRATVEWRDCVGR